VAVGKRILAEADIRLLPMLLRILTATGSRSTSSPRGAARGGSIALEGNRRTNHIFGSGLPLPSGHRRIDSVDQAFRRILERFPCSNEAARPRG